MKRPELLALALLLGGCLSGPANDRAVVSDPVEPAPAEDLTLEGAAHRNALDAEALGYAVIAVAQSPADELALDPAPQCAPEPVVVSDPETVEDNLVLSGRDEEPPENEGVSVPAQEVTFDFPVVENEKVRYFVDYYTGPARRTFARWLKRSGRYMPLMREIFAEEGMPQDLAYLAMVESGFNVKAYSWAHAVGPWQFIESTGKGYGLKGDWWLDERRDFEKSTRAAARFLRDLHKRFDGDWYLAVASYNAGAGKLLRAIKKYDTRDFWELTRGKYLQVETKNYVPKLLAVLMIAKEPEKYGFTDLEYEEPVCYDKVTVPTATDLEIVARLCVVEYQLIKDLNPELKRWCTPPGQTNYTLRVPAGSAEGFEQKYAAIPADQRANYKRHRIASGDTLLKLAQQYRIRVDDIISLNDIKNPRALKIGMNLVLPLSASYTSLPIEEMRDDYVRTRRRTYEVRSGDSLWSIARRFDVTEKELRVWNRLGWSDVIHPGKTLIVSAKAVKSKAKAARAQEPVRKIVYKVKSGDTLWDIGRRYDVSTGKIMTWNNLNKNHILRPGDKLTLMVRQGGRG